MRRSASGSARTCSARAARPRPAGPATCESSAVRRIERAEVDAAGSSAGCAFSCILAATKHLLDHRLEPARLAVDDVEQLVPLARASSVRRDAATAPRIDVIGVRSSWLTEATNCVFMRSDSSSLRDVGALGLVETGLGDRRGDRLGEEAEDLSRSSLLEVALRRARCTVSTPSSWPRFTSGTHIALADRDARGPRSRG